MNNDFYHLSCILCGTKFDEKETNTTCLKCKGPLDIIYDHDYIRSRLNTYSLENSPISGLKYVDFYPIKNLSNIVSLNEGNTPLRHAKNLGKTLSLTNLYIKNESHNPTGVFKDRGSLIEISKAKEMEAKAVCCASTGNMAASVSAYATIAGLPCYVFVPEGTPIGKLAQTLSYGARILQVRGTYGDCVRLCQEAAKKHHFYLAGDYAFRAEGQKSCSYEIIEQLFWKTPDVVIVPMGCGTNISAIWKGFKEFFEFGFISKLPKMIGVQPENVPTIVGAYRAKKKRAIIIEKPNTIASAVGIGVPQDDIKALRTLQESHGKGITANEEELLEAQQQLARMESIFVEPSSAIPVAVLKKLKTQGVIHENSIIVCIATGSGLKDPKSAVAMLPDPPVIEPKNEEVERYLRLKLYALRGTLMTGKERILWQKIPTQIELKKMIHTEFNLELANEYVKPIFEQLKSFREKGREMKKADLQYIIENVLKDGTIKKKILEIIDFHLTVRKHERPNAKVIIRFMNRIIKSEKEGVGPVDAIINAIKSGIEKNDTLKIRLTHYNVEIDTSGTDAAVEVRMGLKDMEDNEVTGSATSPDVIVASTNAFENGYNLLYWKRKKTGSKKS
ncbi:threonine synthase [Candidatus Peregrinibacteria bacterium]|nr:threonine synthase [Candidatus Peregrinibacteria bacterium]